METKGISKLDLKRQNRRQILRVIRENGPTSRVDIAAQLALTRAAVTIITNEMITQGVLEELGEAPIDYKHLQKGRRKILIGINANYKFVLGAMINEDNISVGLATLDGEVLDKEYITIGMDTDQQDIISFIANACHKMMKNSNLSAKQVLGLGLGIVPARWEQMRAEINDGVLSFSKLRYMMELELNVPVHCANAIGLYAMANLDYKDGPRQNQVLLYPGAQYNCAVITDNDLLKDYTINTDYIERCVVRRNGRKCEGYPDGSIHAELRPEALFDRLKDVFAEDVTPILYKACEGKFEACDMKKIRYSYEEGDPGVGEIMNDILEMLALAIHNLSVAHFAHRVILQSFRFGEKTKAQLYKTMCNLVGGEEYMPELVFSSIESERSFLAGCTLAVENMFYEQGGML